MKTEGNHPEKIELLSPAGNFEKLEIAIHYGADAVYLADKEFSLRSFSGNFTRLELDKAIRYAHDHNVKTYIACNIYANNKEQDDVTRYLEFIGALNPDGIIIADPGVLALARKIIPRVPIHLSTQANTTNYHAVQFWAAQGVKRINVARELSLADIKEIAWRCPEVEIESFIHGAMCISYSGRCLLSMYLTNRDSNRGLCSHPCRWRYAVMEEFRPGLYMPLREDDRGSYIFAAKDLCMIRHLPELIAAGVRSLKIEGRMKGIHYLATVVNVYRQALDAYMAGRTEYRLDPNWLEELQAIDNRGYSTGFYFNDPSQVKPNYTFRQPDPAKRFAAKIEAVHADRIHIDVRNKLAVNDRVEVLCKGTATKPDRIRRLFDAEGQPVALVQPGMHAAVQLDGMYHPLDMIRKIEGEA